MFTGYPPPLMPTMCRHSVAYMVVCTLAVAGWWAFGLNATSSAIVWLTAISIATLGVPHGGLDHWLGKRLLVGWCGSAWPFVFFPSYMMLALAVAIAWIVVPFVGIICFFLLSAWHFGREEDKGQSTITAIASGGLVIWIAALARPLEMLEILNALVVSPHFSFWNSNISTAVMIVDATRVMGWILVPIAVFAAIPVTFLAVDGVARHREANRLLPRLATIAVTCWTPILVSFTIYFCVWHSLLGLQRLRRTESLSLGRFAYYVAPLSILAVGLVAVTAWLLGDLSMTTFGRSNALRMTFIGLAAIAVPHILLHEGESWLERRLMVNRVSLQLEGSR